MGQKYVVPTKQSKKERSAWSLFPIELPVDGRALGREASVLARGTGGPRPFPAGPLGSRARFDLA